MNKIFLLLLFTSISFAQSSKWFYYAYNSGETTTPVTTNLVAYYTPSGLSATTWNDVSGNNHNLTLSNVTITANALNGFKGALFNGTSAYGKTADFTYNQPLTIYIVFKDITVVFGDYIISTKEGDLRELTQNNATIHRIYGGKYLNNNYSTINYKVITAVFNGASSYLQRDKQTASSGNAGVLNGTGIAVGCYRYANPALFGNVEIVEMIFYSGAHDLATRTQIQNYLGTKYGLF